jgi:hypothetical protein
MMSLVVCSIVVKLVQSELLLKLSVRLTKPTIKDRVGEVGDADCSDISHCIWKPFSLCQFKVFLCSIVD